MTPEQIAAVMADAVGNPAVGPVAEVIPAMAAAVADALTPKPEPKAKGKADAEA